MEGTTTNKETDNPLPQRTQNKHPKPTTETLSFATASQTTGTMTTTPPPQLPIPQEIQTLISALQTSFSTTHPKIVDIHKLIKDIESLGARIEKIDVANEVLGREIKQCDCEKEEELRLMGEKVTKLAM